MSIKRFEEIEAWQMARVLCQEIFVITNTGGLAKDFSLKDQIHRSSGSIMDNIAEGFDAGGNNEFVRFLNYSKRSASEVQSQLYRIIDRHYCTQTKFEALHEAACLIRAKIGAFIQYLESAERRSPAKVSSQPAGNRQPDSSNREPGTRNRELK